MLTFPDQSTLAGEKSVCNHGNVYTEELNHGPVGTETQDFIYRGCVDSTAVQNAQQLEPFCQIRQGFTKEPTSTSGRQQVHYPWQALCKLDDRYFAILFPDKSETAAYHTLKERTFAAAAHLEALQIVSISCIQEPFLDLVKRYVAKDRSYYRVQEIAPSTWSFVGQSPLTINLLAALIAQGFDFDVVPHLPILKRWDAETNHTPQATKNYYLRLCRLPSQSILVSILEGLLDTKPAFAEWILPRLLLAKRGHPTRQSILTYFGCDSSASPWDRYIADVKTSGRLFRAVCTFLHQHGLQWEVYSLKERGNHPEFSIGHP